MSTLRSALRVALVPDVAAVVGEINRVLERLQGQTRRTYGVEPSRKPVETVTAARTLTEGDMVLRVDATSAPVTVTLPPAAGAKGLTFWVKKVDASANAVTVDANGSETIDGATTASTTTQYTTFRLVSNGTSWDLL